MLRMTLVAVLCLGWATTGTLADLPMAMPTSGPAAAAPTLDGVWEITALIGNGETYSAKDVHEKLAKDGRLTISGQTIKLVRPRNNEQVTMLFVNDTKVNPMTIDFAGSDKIGSKGIYQMLGDMAMVCVSDPGIDARPKEFSAREGSNAILMTLRRVVTPVVTTTTPVIPTPLSSLSDDAIRNLLIGTWGHQDDDKVELGTFNADGSVSITKTWKKSVKRLFEGGDGRSSGEWKLNNGNLIVKITASTDKEVQGQIFTYRINSITDRDLLVQAPDGKTRREWKTK